jgi:hypothetical protein
MANDLETTLAKPVNLPPPVEEPVLGLSIGGAIKSKDAQVPSLPIAFHLTLKLEAGAPGSTKSALARSDDESRKSIPGGGGQAPDSVPPPSSPPSPPQLPVLDEHNAELTTDVAGAFQYVYNVPFALNPQLKGSITCALTLQAHVPGAPSWTMQVTATGTTAHEILVSLGRQLASIVYKIPFAGLVQFPAVIFLGTDRDTQDYFADTERLELGLHYTTAKGNGAAPEVYRFPCARLSPAATTFSGAVILEHDQTVHGTYHLEATKPYKSPNQDVLRTVPLAGNAYATEHYGYVMRLVVEQTGADISGKLKDRYAAVPFVLRDIRIDLQDGGIRVRGSVSIGTSADMVLFSIGSFDAVATLTPRNLQGQPFTDAEYDELFDVSVSSIKYDALPGTDIDELPAWVWALILPIAPSLTGLEALIVAFEALAKPVVRSIVEARTLSILGQRVKHEKKNKTAGLSAELQQKFSYQTDSISITSQQVEVAGFFGFWGSASDLGAVQQ